MQVAKENKCHREKSRVAFEERIREEKMMMDGNPSHRQGLCSVYIHLLGLMFSVIRHGTELEKYSDLLPPEATKLS